MQKTLAIIPARGGSKSIKRKNVAILAGRPLIAWTIDCALSCAALDRVIVSTDDLEIATVARQYGADTPFMRPASLARDEAAMIDVIQHAVATVEHGDERFDVVVLLQPTSPLRNADDIEACIEPVRARRNSAAMTVCEAEHNPFCSMGQIVDQRWLPLFPKHHGETTRRQDAPVVYRETGAVFVWRRCVVMDQRTLCPPDICLVVTPAERSLDIDSLAGMKVAEVLLR